MELCFFYEIVVMKVNTIKQAVCELLIAHQSAALSAFETQCVLPHPCTDAEAIGLINQFWRDLLGRQPRDTMEARSYLLDECCPEEWLSLFERGVLPEVLQ